MSVMLLLLGLGLFGTLALAVVAFSGPSANKATKRRLEMIRERHVQGNLAVAANAQIRKLFANRNSKVEGWFSTLVPKPALMRLRLERTGKNITLGKYAMVSVGLVAVVATLLMLKGMPFLLATLLGLFVGIGLPHFVVGKMIAKRLKMFNVNFPDAIELMVRGLRSGLPITETLSVVSGEIPGPVGLEFRTVSDKMKIGRTMESALQDRVPVLRHHPRDPARDRRQPGGNAVEPRRRAAQAGADEAQDQGDELGSQGLGDDRRRPALHRLHARLHAEPQLHGRLLRRAAADRRRAGRDGVDGHRRGHHGQDGQLRDLRGETNHGTPDFRAHPPRR
jgi:hypothetical protein